MIALDAIAQSAKEGAESIFRYVERTAEATGDGVRWQTLSYENRPYYDASVFNGVGGIPLFLADYYRLTGDRQALELGIGGTRWCLAGKRTWAGGRGPSNVSLCFGRAGAGMAWLRLAQVAGDTSLLDRACEVGERVAGARLGPVADFIGGVAGQGVFFLRLWEATHDQRHLDAAAQRGAWLAEHAIRDERGLVWSWRVDRPDEAGTGFAHGCAGVAHFFTLLAQTTGDAQWRRVAEEAIETLARHAVPDRGGLNWPLHFGRQTRLACQWCWGSPGIGLLFVKAHEVMGEARYLDIATAAGETTYAYGDVRHNPSQCHGLAGNAELFVELYRLTRDRRWLERAHDFARRCLSYRTTGPEGDTWQADEPGISSPDFMSGAAGTGHFFLRLLRPDEVRMPLQ